MLCEVFLCTSSILCNLKGGIRIIVIAKPVIEKLGTIPWSHGIVLPSGLLGVNKANMFNSNLNYESTQPVNLRQNPFDVTCARASISSQGRLFK